MFERINVYFHIHTFIFTFMFSCHLKSSTFLYIIYNKINRNKLLRHQKHASRIIFFKDKVTHAIPLLQSINTLNSYQLNIFYILLFTHTVENKETPQIIRTVFSRTKIKYNTLHNTQSRLTFSNTISK